MSWAERADRVLDKLFVAGEEAPSKDELREAYPFGERRYHPYKVWLARVAAWRHAHALGMRAWYPKRRSESKDPNQHVLGES